MKCPDCNDGKIITHCDCCGMIGNICQYCNGVYILNEEICTTCGGSGEIKSAKSYDRGHEIYFKNNNWFYSDTNDIVDHKRPCKKCGKHPTKEGYDACLGHIDGVSSACCGHSVSEPIRVEHD